MDMQPYRITQFTGHPVNVNNKISIEILFSVGQKNTDSESRINKFLKTNYPRGRAIGAFRPFHFGLKAQKTKFVYFTSPKTAMAFLTSPQGEVEAETQWQTHEELLD